jgi:hypothetical protein
MAEMEEPYVRRIVFPPTTLRRLEHDALANRRSLNDQVIYVLTIGHRELDDRPPLPKYKHPQGGRSEN